MPITGYKIAKANPENTRVIITLEIPDDAITNIERRSILCKETAYHRTNKAKVIRIKNQHEDTCFYEAVSAFADKPITYRVGEIVCVEDFNKNLELVFAEGIHFFLDYNVALNFLRPVSENDVYQNWYENGLLREFYTIENGKKNGIQKTFYPNGQLRTDGELVDGLFIKERKWYDNGMLQYNIGIEDDKYVIREYYLNGNSKKEESYTKESWMDSKRRLIHAGPSKFWYENGKLSKQITFYENEVNMYDLIEVWDENGNKKKETKYSSKNRNSIEYTKEWHDNWVDIQVHSQKSSCVIV